MSITRRTFVQRLAVTSAVIAVAPCLVEAASLANAPDSVADEVASRADGTSPVDRNGAPVVAFHMDQPYLDISGCAVPYRPPAGMRSAQPVAELSEATFQCCFWGA